MTHITPAFNSCDDTKILALCIYGEARGEGIEGMLAVASVVLNRARMSKKTIKAICLQPRQFSCFNPEDPNREILEKIALNWDRYIEINKYLRQSFWIAKGVIENWLISNVDKATHYHHISIKPSWADKLERITRIGNHVFYYEKGWR